VGGGEGRVKGSGGAGKTKKQLLEEAKEREAEAGRSKEPWTVLVHRKVEDGWVLTIPRQCGLRRRWSLKGGGWGERSVATDQLECEWGSGQCSRRKEGAGGEEATSSRLG